jgi:hypothetical protein
MLDSVLGVWLYKVFYKNQIKDQAAPLIKRLGGLGVLGGLRKNHDGYQYIK